jgi:iron complex outermembrane receptor protein
MSGDNYEGALEWYFAPGGSLTATAFSHHFNNYVATRSADEVFNGTTYNVTRPYNTTSGTLNGVEVGYQQFYDKLPGVLGGLGLQANVTFMQGTTSDEGASAHPITGVSRMSYNIAGLYERNGISGRLAYNWRSKFTDSYNQGGPGLDLIVAPVGQLDGSLSYKLNDRTSVVLEGTNLLDTKFRDYWNNQAVYPRDVRRYDRTVSVGVNWRL